jgi:hypothetical protein
MTADGVNTAMSKLLENQVRHALRRARQKARAVRGGGRGLEGENLLSTATPTVAARSERKHQRPAAEILPE